MGSMHTGLEEHPDGAERLAAFYAERARHGVALIVTGGVAPAPSGVGMEGGAVLNDASQLPHHRLVTDAVHQEGGKIALQILHTGRYSYQPNLVAPSAIQAPINRFTPHALSHDEILALIDDFAHCAQLAQQAGYDGVEVMGSEGYLINEFLAARTNQRDDEWGGDYARRRRFALDVVRAVRERVGRGVYYHLPPVDARSGGRRRHVGTDRAAGAGGRSGRRDPHQHRHRLARGAHPDHRHAGAARGLQLGDAQAERESVHSAGHHQPHQRSAGGGNDLISHGDADMVSMARPFLADAELLSKAQSGRADEINTCIGCNQACLDQIFVGKVTSCLVNPRACHETQMPVLPALQQEKRLAVVGAGPAGLAFAVNAAARGHSVTLFDALAEIGGQFNIAKQIPGKEEFYETLRYYRRMLELTGVELCLNQRVDPSDLTAVR